MTTTFEIDGVEITRDGFNVYKSGLDPYTQIATKSRALHEDVWIYRDCYENKNHQAAFTNENDAAEYIAYRFSKLTKLHTDGNIS